MKTSALRILSVCALMVAGLMAGSMGAQEKATPRATTLDAGAAKDLAAGKVWQIKKQRGPGNDYWAWKSDGSVCVRLGEKTGKCADTGRWKMDREKVCYELTWWGETYGLKSTCFRVSNQGNGRYAWLQDNAIPFNEFSVAK